MSKSFWSNWVFWKPSKNKASDVEIAKQARINEMLAEPTTLQNQYKLMTVRAIMVTHENGEFKPNIGMPECLFTYTSNTSIKGNNTFIKTGLPYTTTSM